LYKIIQRFTLKQGWKKSRFKKKKKKYWIFFI